ncbi:MAG: hypothetical protein M3R27_05915 [Bacteroidota bacterium]|nr:hypothetical protein [Bacteroidota bacterium]
MKESTALVTISDDRFGRKDGKYSETQDKIRQIFKSNDHFGIDKFIMWKWEDFETTNTYLNNMTLFDNTDAARNGRAYKPAVILMALEELKENDFLIYTDCSPEIWNMDADYKIDTEFIDIDVLKGLCVQNNDILTAFVKWDDKPIGTDDLGIHTHKNFTLDRCIDRMNLRFYKDAYMHASGMWVIRKTKKTVKLIEDWLAYNLIDECCSLGWAHIPNDDSFWTGAEENTKMGCRHDQSISGLLLARINQKFVDIVYNDMHPYNFLQFARKDHEYKFIECLPKIDIGDSVVNKQGTEMKVWRIETGHYVVGQLEASLYATSRENLKLIKKSQL